MALERILATNAFSNGRTFAAGRARMEFLTFPMSMTAKHISNKSLSFELRAWESISVNDVVVVVVLFVTVLKEDSSLKEDSICSILSSSKTFETFEEEDDDSSSPPTLRLDLVLFLFLVVVVLMVVLVLVVAGIAAAERDILQIKSPGSVYK